MDNPHLQLLLLFAALTAAASITFYLKRKLSRSPKKHPPGSLGLPILGEIVSAMNALRLDRAHEWIRERVAEHGPVFMTSFVGTKTVIMTGEDANKFIFSASDETLRSHQSSPIVHVVGKHSLFEYHGAKHKMVRGAMLGFLRPDSLQRYVPRMDSLVQYYLQQELEGKDTTKAVPLLKNITFRVTTTLLFMISDEKVKDMLYKDFSLISKGIWSVPLYFPGTTFYHAMRARERIVDCFSNLIGERKRTMETGKIVGSQHDMISSLLSLRDEDGRGLTEDEIIDNLVGLTIASHDTTTSLLTSFVRVLARDAFVYEQVYKEQAKVVSEKEEKYVTWRDIQKMKYTWRVAKELLRMYPPLFGNFRKVVKDTSFNGFDIPRGWQVEWTTTSHMDGKIFKEPTKFDPSRFEASRTHPPYTYVPFGAGQRMCPGSEYSKAEVLLIVHHFIMNYRFSEMIPNEPLTRIPVTSPAMGLPIKLEKIK